MVRWRAAMEQALYGPDGFYLRNRPGRHFRTSAQSPLFAAALARLAVRVDDALGRPSTFDLVDVGAGSGELLTNIMAALPEPARSRTRPVAVELAKVVADGEVSFGGFRAQRAHGGDIDWAHEVPDGVTGLLIATEWLDNVPLDLAQNGRYLWDGAPLGDEDAEWIQAWWPDPDGIVEIGRARDEAWASVVRRVSAGLALTVDYGHLRGTRPKHPTVAGFRDGREVEPHFDGSTDITCHVAMDSVGAAGSDRYWLKTQREALAQLGVDGARPPLELAHKDPSGYVKALAKASEAAMLTDPGGLGGHWWLSHLVGISLPALD